MDLLKRLDELRELPQGWNSYNSYPISEKAIQKVMEACNEHGFHQKGTPKLVPTVGGGVQMEWHEGEVDLEVNFTEDNKTKWHAWDVYTGEESSGTLEDELTALMHLFDKMSIL